MSRAKRAVGLLVALVGVAALTSPAAADPPPGVGALPDGEWVAFTLGETSLTAPRGGSQWGPVSLNREAFVSGSIEDLFSNWDVDDVTLEKYWPSSWSASGFTLERAVPMTSCPAAASSCSYNITGGSGTFEVNAGTPLQPGQSLPLPQPVTLVPPLPAEISVQVNQNLNPVKGQNGQPGTITLDASGTTDGDTSPDSLAYAWTVAGNGVTKTAAGKVATVQLDQDGQYDITLAVTNPVDGHVTTYNGAISVAGVAPDKPSQGGNGGSGGGGSGGGTGGPAPLPTPPAQGVAPEIVAEPVVFAPPRRSVPSALFGGQNGEAQVVWLWRPEWAGAPAGPRNPRTSAPPIVRERDDIIVGSSGPSPDSNAAPWLAGLGVFGLCGVGWLLTRRHRMRAEL
jgi:hypothetical protein